MPVTFELKKYINKAQKLSKRLLYICGAISLVYSCQAGIYSELNLEILSEIQEQTDQKLSTIPACKIFVYDSNDGSLARIGSGMLLTSDIHNTGSQTVLTCAHLFQGFKNKNLDAVIYRGNDEHSFRISQYECISEEQNSPDIALAYLEERCEDVPHVSLNINTEAPPVDLFSIGYGSVVDGLTMKIYSDPGIRPHFMRQPSFTYDWQQNTLKRELRLEKYSQFYSRNSGAMADYYIPVPEASPIQEVNVTKGDSGSVWINIQETAPHQAIAVTSGVFISPSYINAFHKEFGRLTNKFSIVSIPQEESYFYNQSLTKEMTNPFINVELTTTLLYSYVSWIEARIR